MSALAQVRAAEPDWTAIERESRSCVQKDPGSIDCAVKHADALRHLDQPYDAIIQLEPFIAAHPDAVPAVMLYAQLLQNVAQDAGAAEAALRKATEVVKDDAGLWQALGALYAGQHKSKEAIDAYQKALALHPKDPVLLAGDAYSRYLGGEIGKAQEEFKRALELNGRLKVPKVGVPVLYGVFLRDSGEAAESIPQFTRALEMDSRLWQIYYERGLAYERRRDFSNAEKDALIALKGEGDRRDIRLLLLRIYRAKGDSAKVAEETAAIEKLNKIEDAYYATAREMRESLSQAEAAVTKGDCAAAVPPYERVVQLMPTFYEAWFPLGVCYSRAGERDKAEQALRTYLRYQPLSGDGHSALGLVYVADGRRDEAKAELKKAVDIDPTEVEAAAALARIEYDGKQFRDAAQLSAHAISADPNATANTYAVAAESEAVLGNRDKAMEYLEQGIKKWPDDKDLQSIHAALLTECLYAQACKISLLRAVAEHPSSLPYRKAAARAMVMANAWDGDTERTVTSLVADYPKDPEARLIEAVWQERRNKLPEAKAAAQQALAVAPQESGFRVSALEMLARSCGTAEDSSCARENFEKAWELDRRLGVPDPSCGVSWAEFLERNGERKAALPVLDEVVRSAPAFAPAYVSRARALAREGDAKRAIDDALQAVRISDNPERLREAHALLATLYTEIGEAQKAKLHQEWVEAHR